MKYIVLAALGAAVTGFLLGWAISSWARRHQQSAGSERDEAVICRHALGVYRLDLL